MNELKLFYDKILNSPKKFKLLWNLNTKRSQWVKTTDDILKAIQVNNTNMFFGLGMTDKSYGPGKRALNTQISTVSCLYIDIDIASDNVKVHKKENLPKTLEEAIEIACKFLEPTFIVFSGHGIHAYYCTAEPIDLKKDGKLFASLLRQFQDKHRKAFPQYQLDYTHDLARVLRCPGTINAKDPDNPVECVIIQSNDVDYWIEEIQDAIEYDPELVFETELPFDNKNKLGDNPEKALSLNSTQEFIQWFDEQGLVLDPQASLDAETWVELEQATSGELSQLYNHKKTKHVDINNIDMSLANMGAKNCLTDQQIIDLMVMHRRKHGVNTSKLKRKDYFARTLIKAISDRLLENIRQKKPTYTQQKPTYTQQAVSRTSEKSDDEQSEIVLSTKRTIFDNHAPSEKQTIRKHLAGLMGVEIKRIVCYPKDPEPVFELELSDMPGRMIQLGTYQKGIMIQGNFRASIAAMGLPMPKRVAKEIWDPTVLNDLRILTEEGAIPETATYEGQVKIYLKDYFTAKGVESKKVVEKESDQEYPHLDPQTERVAFNLDHFRRWLSATKGIQLQFSLENTMFQSGFVMGKEAYYTPPMFFIPEWYEKSKDKKKKEK
jgi:hypothetical protein